MDKDKLLARKVSADTTEVPIGDLGCVTVRGLSRAEVRAARIGATDRRGEVDEDDEWRRMIAAALVDPEMTPDEVGEWLDDAPAGDSVAVMSAVQELSAMTREAPKSGVRGVRRSGKRR